MKFVYIVLLKNGNYVTFMVKRRPKYCLLFSCRTRVGVVVVVVVIIVVVRIFTMGYLENSLSYQVDFLHEHVS